MPAINQSPKYRKFINERDKALELIHHHAQSAITHATAKYLSQVLLFAKGLWLSQKTAEVISFGTLEHQMHMASGHLVDDVLKVYREMARAAYLLAYTGEAEAIGRALGKKTKHNPPAKDIGTDVQNRIVLYVNKLRRDLTTAVERALLSRVENESEFLNRIKRKFPKTISVHRNRKLLKKPVVKESDQTKEDPMAFGFVDDAEWNDLVEKYMSDYVPDSRGPEAVLPSSDTEMLDLAFPDKETWYAWEMERDVTHGFVQSVRDGQIESAKENGITDFLWIAILDDRTDDCCEWRDGLSTKEIEEQLNADHQDDECDATVPPAHFNCRCTLAPITDDLPEKPDSNEQEFQDWLNS